MPGKKDNYSKGIKCQTCAKLIGNSATWCKKCSVSGVNNYHRKNPGKTYRMSPEARAGMKGRMMGEKNGGWKGDSVSYVGVHAYVRRHLPKPDFCVRCGKVPPKQISNNSGKYLRALSDWEWLCVRCHMKKDGWDRNLRHRHKKK